MDIRLFKKILKEFENSTIHKLEVTDKDFTVKMEKKPEYVEVKETLPSSSQSVSDDQEESMVQKLQYTSVKSPLVGTYYNAPSPESSPFIKVNQKVSEGDVLCIVEAMKVMNEIRSPISGTIKNIHVLNEAMVEFGQVLIEIEEV